MLNSPPLRLRLPIRFSGSVLANKFLRLLSLQDFEVQKESLELFHNIDFEAANKPAHSEQDSGE